MKSVLSLDFETASTADLRKTGADRYARDPSTRVLCLAWAFDDGPVSVWKIGDNPATLMPVVSHIWNGGRVRAWNAQFEYLIWNHCFINVLRVAGLFAGTRQRNILIEHGQLEDTMIQAAYWGLPLALQTTSDIIAPDKPKDATGHRLMMQMCKPRSLDMLTGKATWWHEDDPAKLERLAQYCKQDVEAERTIASRLLPMPPSERQNWLLDQKINQRGVRIDMPTVRHMIKLADEAKLRANDRLVDLTQGQVKTITSTAKLLEWAKSEGYQPDNLRRDTILKALDEDPMLGDLQEVLELRIDNAKTSVAKLRKMISCANVQDHRVRGMMQFYGAFRTGRWAGRLVQLQNMPRGEFDDLEAVVSALKNQRSYDWIEKHIGPPARVVSSGLRACLAAEEGSTFVCADLGQIEARVVAWLAGQQDILDVFASGKDVYAYTAAQVTGKPIEECQKGVNDLLRNLGKVLVLACGFGMGAPKFRETAEKSGVVLSEDEAQDAVTTWRQANSFIQQFWWDADNAMRAVVSGRVDTAYLAGGKIKLQAYIDMHGRHILAVLPSGKRCLVYREARLETDPSNPTGKPIITYMGLNQYTNRWERLRTYGGKLVENFVQATARDIIAAGMQRCEDAGLPVILTVHDELLAEVPEKEAQKTCQSLLSNLTKHDTWYADLPVKADAWVNGYYKK